MRHHTPNNSENQKGTEITALEFCSLDHLLKCLTVDINDFWEPRVVKPLLPPDWYNCFCLKAYGTPRQLCNSLFIPHSISCCQGHLSLPSIARRLFLALNL